MARAQGQFVECEDVVLLLDKVEPMEERPVDGEKEDMSKAMIK
jgi:hypothetical protein